jgi:hypothetical protein
MFAQLGEDELLAQLRLQLDLRNRRLRQIQTGISAEIQQAAVAYPALSRYARL